MNDPNTSAHASMQLLIWDTRDDGLPCLGCTLDLVNRRLWFASEKCYVPGEVAEFKIRMGWKRRIICTLRVLTATCTMANDFAYIGEFVKIDPADLQELDSVISGYQSDHPCIEAACAAPSRVDSLCMTG